MIEGRGKVKKYDGQGEEARADNEPGVSVPYCMHDEKRSSDECGNQPYTMANAIRNFFRLRLFTLGVHKQYTYANSFRRLTVSA